MSDARAVKSIAQPEEERELASLYQAAVRNGAVNLYASGPAALYQQAAGRFENQFPGVKVYLKYGHSDPLVQVIEAERREGCPRVDVTIHQSIQAFERWKAEGALQTVSNEGLAQVLPEFKDPEGTYVGAQVYGLLYAYHSGSIKAADIPRSAPDFLDSKFDGQIGLSYPHADDVTLYLLHTIVEKYGWTFVEGLMKNHPTFVVGHAPLAQRIADGQLTVTFDAIPNLCLGERRAGKPIEIHVSTEDAIPIWAQMAAIFQDAPHPEAARLFMAWHLSKKQQEIMIRDGMWSPRRDVVPPMPLRPIGEHKVANRYREFMMNEPLVIEMRRRCEQLIGPAIHPT